MLVKSSASFLTFIGGDFCGCERNSGNQGQNRIKIPEAAEYSNIGQNKLSELMKKPRCPFVLYVGTKKLVKRKEFERFISENIEL